MSNAKEKNDSLQGTIKPKDLTKFDPSRVLNLNVGVLGHVDSGMYKCRILSTSAKKDI